MLDPKENWAVRHLEQFPVEVNRAPYERLLRVPGIGVKSAKRIVAARRSARLRFEDLRRIGVVLKRALYFITCGGRMMYPTKLEENYIVRNLTNEKDRVQFGSDGMTYQQMSLFDDGRYSLPTEPDTVRAFLRSGSSMPRQTVFLRVSAGDGPQAYSWPETAR